jgi:hypothetical protein
MAITSLFGRVIVSFVTQDELEQLAQQLLACLLLRGREVFPESGWPVLLAGTASGREACGPARLLHDELLEGWSRQQ